MDALKRILISVYAVIIILLLLSMIKCDRQVTQQELSVSTDTIIPKPVIKESFKADVVMCIDCTNSMNGIIETIKNNALTFYPDLKRKCVEQGKAVTSMRIKVIGFRDLGDALPFEESTFFDIPKEENNFKAFVSNLRPFGGGDNPELGYDALGRAINSDWLYGNDVHQVIILWTDDGSHSLSGRSSNAANMNQLTSLWNNKMSAKGKRLILFAPSDRSWTKLVNNWDNTTRHDVNAGGGLSDIDYNEILKTLSETM